MKFNLNQYVKIKLTDYGRHILEADHNALYVYFSNPPKFVMPKEDAGGWSKWQLHYVFARFGKYIGMGKEIPFETTIIILDEPL